MYKKNIIISKLYLPTFSDFTAFILAITIILCMGPYFTWTTFCDGKFYFLVPSFMIFSCLCMSLHLLCKKIFIKCKHLILLFLLLLLQLHVCFNGVSYVPGISLGIIFIILNITFFSILDKKTQKKCWNFVIFIFLLLTLPSIILFILRLISNALNLPLSYHKLMPEDPGKVAKGWYYQQYWCGLLIVTSNAKVRLCGFFDEPGMVGTMSAFLLAGNIKVKDKKWINLLLLLCGIFSFSLAFYIMAFLTIMLKALADGFVRFFFATIASLTVLILFFNIETSNQYIHMIRDRFSFNADFFIKDNRTNQAFDSEYMRFLQSEGLEIWVGNGAYASNNNKEIAGSSSYKTLFYDYGIIGLLLLAFILLNIVSLYRISNFSYIFLFIFLISIYQRPYVMRIPQMLIFMAALSNNEIYKGKKNNYGEYYYEKNDLL